MKLERLDINGLEEKYQIFTRFIVINSWGESIHHNNVEGLRNAHRCRVKYASSRWERMVEYRQLV